MQNMECYKWFETFGPDCIFIPPTISEHMTSRDITVNCEPKLQAVKLRRNIDFFPFQFLIKHERWIFPLTFNNKKNT